ncbi:conserved hypothetical protein [Vibrio phage 424E50-1]|nr:conserved hypothetical protein [Vibrio phage 424E50-1]
MSSIPDIKIDTDGDWVSINSESGIAIGVAVKIQNKSTQPYLLFESSSKPLTTSFSGEVITPLNSTEPSKIVTQGSEEIWVRNTTLLQSHVFLHVQEI